MGSKAIRFKVQPRLVPAAVAARRLGLSGDEFIAKLPRLLLEGFPSAVPVADQFDLVAIDVWLDRRAGLDPRDERSAARASIAAKLRAFDG